MTLHAGAGISMIRSIAMSVLPNLPQNKTNQEKNAMNVAKHYLVLAFQFWKRCFTKRVSRVLFVKKVLRRDINAINWGYVLLCLLVQKSTWGLY